MSVLLTDPTPNVVVAAPDEKKQAPVVEEKKPPAPLENNVASLQQEENVSISGSNARLMIMKKLSRKAQVSNLQFACPCLCVLN